MYYFHLGFISLTWVLVPKTCKIPGNWKWPGTLEKKIFKFVQAFLLFRYYLHLYKDRALHLNKLESPSPKKVLCQVWLNFAQWFWRRRWKCEKFTDRWTNSKTDKGKDDRQAIRKAQLRFQLKIQSLWYFYLMMSMTLTQKMDKYWSRKLT